MAPADPEGAWAYDRRFSGNPPWIRRTSPYQPYKRPGRTGQCSRLWSPCITPILTNA